MSRHGGETKSKSTAEVKNIPARRLYRGVLEYARRLENGRQHRRNLMSVFQSEQIGLRHKLRDACEKLMFTFPVEYGKKAEELMWRKVYYEVIQLVKGNRKFIKPGSKLELLYKEYLAAAIGYYHHLLLKLQTHFQLRVDVDWPFANSPLSDKSYQTYQNTNHSQLKSSRTNEKEDKQKEIISEEKNKEDEKKAVSEWARDTCYRILMCLGDLGRYQIEHDGSRPFAERFYQLALLVKPNIGMPFNQLGTLAGHHTWWGLSAAYYYYRCLEAEHKFQGADGNLQKLLDRNKKSFYQIPTDALENVIHVEDYRKEHTRTFIISFLYLCDLLRPKTYATDVEITGMCKKLIDALPVCLAHCTVLKEKDPHAEAKENNYKQMTARSTLKPQHNHHHHFPTGDFSRLHPHVVFKMCILCLINIHSLQSSRSNRSSAAIAFALAFFSHLLGHVISLLNPDSTSQENDDLSMQNSNKTMEKENNISYENGEGDASHANIKENAQTKKKKTRLLRRRRHRGSGDSDLSEGEVVSGSGDSDSDEDSSSSSSAAYSNSELSQEDVEDVINADSSPKSQEKNGESAEKKNKTSPLSTGLIDNHAGLELANSLANGKSTMASLKDISQKMFQPTTKRRILLAPSFFNNITSAPKPKPSTLNDKENGQKNGKIDVGKVENKPVTEEEGPKDSVEKETSHDENKEKETNGKSTEDETNENKNLKQNVEEAEGEKLKQENTIPVYSDELKLRMFHKMAAYHQLFACLKLLCDWLSANENVTSACAQNSKALWSRLARLANSLPDENILLEQEELSSDKIMKKQLEIMKSTVTSAKKWKQTARLPEDYILHQSAGSVSYSDEKEKKLTTLICELTDTQQNTIRLCRVRSLCHSLVRVDGLEMKYNETTKQFEGPTEPSNEEADHLDIETMEEMRKARLMKAMAELRLRNEVTALENQLGAPDTRDASLCLYLVPDALALCHDLGRIRKLLASEQYFVVIPNTVIDGLDGLKKDLQGARDAIRFLETEFKKGNRFIRAQKKEETSRGVLGERPKLRRNDTRAWRFYRIIECCRYIMQERSKTDNSDTSGMVTILTHSTDKGTLSQNQINAISAAETFGIQVFSAQQFTSLLKRVPPEPRKGT